MQKLNLLINQLENKIDFYESKNLVVSKSTIGWQIDHSLKVLIVIISVLKKSNPTEYQWKFNLARFVCLSLNYFPRGKATAPKTVRTYEKILQQDLINQIETLKNLILELNSLHKNSNFSHPFFGKLNLKQSIRFLEIHTYHHLKIINDILIK